jgi:hypothetical protein
MKEREYFILLISLLSLLLMAAVPVSHSGDEQPDILPQYSTIDGHASKYFTNKLVYFNPQTLVYEAPKLRLNMAATAKVSTTPRNQIKSGFFKPCSSCSTTYQWAIVEVMVPAPGKCRWTYTYDN